MKQADRYMIMSGFALTLIALKVDFVVVVSFLVVATALSIVALFQRNT